MNETDRVPELDCSCLGRVNLVLWEGAGGGVVLVREGKADFLGFVGGQVFLFLGFR